MEVLDLRLDGLLDGVAMDTVTSPFRRRQEVVVADGRDVALRQVLTQSAQVRTLATARRAFENNWLARGGNDICEEGFVERRVGHLVSSRDVEVFEQRRRRHCLQDRSDCSECDPTVWDRQILLDCPIDGHALQGRNALGRGMRAQTGVDFVLQNLEAFVAVADVELAEELVAVLLSAKLSDDRLQTVPDLAHRRCGGIARRPGGAGSAGAGRLSSQTGWSPPAMQRQPPLTLSRFLSAWSRLTAT